MIRLPSTHAAITAPLVVSSAAFPGVPIGRSLLDGRPFHLSPVLTDMAVLPSTNSLALGGLGSGKSTTDKTWIRREVLEIGHQAVIVDNFGEDQSSGEWAPVTRSLGGRVIQAGSFTLNPCSELFSPEVREQLVRSLILAVDPDALTTHSTHALQHALTHPKATSLNGVVDALVQPEDGRWPAATLADWGVNAAIALSRYTEGSLQGLFDGQDASLPETDLPVLSFDFSRMDRNSPAIPSLMAAVSCWVEHVWLPQSTAAHRHLVLEEAWQILLSPATAELIQRLMKNSRRAALSIKALMHTLSDLGTDRAQDLARLCEIVHVGRLGPEEAAKVGALLGLPAWAIDRIPSLGPGEAVWKVGPDYVDIVKTVITEEEARLTDTSSRRRKAQQAMTADLDVVEQLASQVHDEDQDDVEPDDILEHCPDVLEPVTPGEAREAEDWDWEMPPNVIDTRHQDALQAAREGRCSEAADLAALGERQDIAAHGINSDQAVSWLVTRARVAELCGNLDQATQLRATVVRMGKDVDRADWLEQTKTPPTGPQWHRGPDPAVPETPAGHIEPVKKQHRTWPYIAALAALAIGIAGVYQKADDDEREQKAAAYKGRSGASLTIDGVEADVVARWSRDRDRVILELRASFEPNSKFLRIDASGKSAQSVRENGWYPKAPEISVPVEDYLADVTVRVAIGGKSWKPNVRVHSKTIRLSPTGVAYDAQTGEKLPSDV
ncbi:hypothetical protein AB0N88_16090 [Streptomyces sp. NPDC093516]|uniref:hypothetical protein n=1 Tax=Streptomyces sp. NPDC093516 TaxID=3155304 RepID=UPI003429386E